MKPPQIVKTIEKWQSDMMTKTRGVFVRHFSLQPQAQGFMIELEINDEGEGCFERVREYVFGNNLSEVFDKSVKKIEDRKAILREALNG